MMIVNGLDVSQLQGGRIRDTRKDTPQRSFLDITGCVSVLFMNFLVCGFSALISE